MRQILFSVLFLFISINSYCQVNNEFKSSILTYGGLPEVENQNIKILYNEAFIVGYSEELKNPRWVCYRLGNLKTDMTVPKFERPYSFYVDNRTESKVSHNDYTSSGYDRGHMAPNSALLINYGQMAQLETFLMSNITPQSPKLNRNIWEKLERKVREEVSQDDTKNKEITAVYVITGTIFSDSPEKMESGIPIPSHCYKIFAYQRGYGSTIKSVAFIFPQEPLSLELMDYIVTVDEVEQKSGINFFPELTEQKQQNLERVKRNFLLEEINN
jgi:endonuclease G